MDEWKREHDFQERSVGDNLTERFMEPNINNMFLKMAKNNRHELECNQTIYAHALAMALSCTHFLLSLPFSIHFVSESNLIWFVLTTNM